jgi:acetoin utilization deacetylase AcuC-like enzyme
LYPGTGSAADVGSGEGTGYTVNLPVPPGAGDDVFVGLVEQVAVPLAASFRPQLLLISAGFDAHRDDPLADCAVTEAGFARMAAVLSGAGGELGAPVGAVLEGGYGLVPLGRSVAATLEALSLPDGSDLPSGGSGAVDGLVEQARARLSQWWPALG